MRSQFQALIGATPRLYYSLLQILRKPFYIGNGHHSYLFRRMIHMIMTLVRKHSPDAEIYDAIRRFMNAHIYPKYGFPNHEGVHRASCRVDDIVSLISSYKPASLVDIGCSTGIITRQLGIRLGLEPSSIWGVDIVRRNIEGITYICSEAGIPLESDSIDLAIMIMSLHHIKLPSETLGEVFRILKPGGLLVIKEHDIATDDTDAQTYLDILHGLYSLSWCKEGYCEDPDFCINYWANYRSKEDWTTLIETIGFRRDTKKPLYNMAECEREYTGVHIRNIGYSYWAIYEK